MCFELPVRNLLPVGINVARHKTSLLTLYCLGFGIRPDRKKFISANGIRIFDEVTDKYFIRKLEHILKGGYPTIVKQTEDLAEFLGDDLIRVLDRNDFVVRFKKKNFDLLDGKGKIAFRGNKDDMVSYLKYISKPEGEKNAALARINGLLQRGTNKFNPSSAASKGFPGIKSSSNGCSPDFSHTPQYLYGGNTTKSVGKIKLTGDRGPDFDQAFEKILGITNRAQKNQILKKYTWHHVDDLDPESLEGTMQLVLKDAHDAACPHYGSGKQFQDLVELTTEYK